MNIKTKNIWIIDDDQVYTFGVKKIIRNHLPENNISSFKNGKKALEAMEKVLDTDGDLPELILLDIAMPEMNGWDFLRALEELDERLLDEIRVFVISSNIEQESDQLYRVEWDEKISDFIKKPVHIEALKKILG